MTRILNWLDAALGLAFFGALLAGVLSAWPGSVRAADVAEMTARGSVTMESRQVSGFEAVAVTGGIDLHVHPGTQELVQVRAQVDLFPLIETVVENHDGRRTLVVRWKKGAHVNLKSAPQVDVSVQRLVAVSTAGSSDVVVEPIQTPTLQVAIAGNGDVLLKGLNGEELRVKIAGSGDFRASGQVTRLSVGVSGSGDVRTDDLAADEVSISIAGSGDASVQARKTLAVSIAGSGDVSYRGDAQVKSSIAGSGSVHKR